MIPYARVCRSFRDSRGKTIGLIIEKDNHRWFWKSVDRAKHFHRNHRSWAIASSLVAELHRDKVEGIFLDVKDEGIFYSSLSDFEKHSIIDRFEPYEEQNFLHEHYWKMMEDDQ